ncbi:MAG: MFS transporter [Syntrophomonas sp.]
MKLDEKWLVLVIICVGIFMSTLDGSILNIANPIIAKSISVSMQQIQWVVTAYMLVITASLLFFGKLGDKVGSSKIYTYGFLVFTIGSFLCSLSPSLLFLISARVLQAFGASMLMATGIGIVSNAFPSDERGKALGITGSVVGVGNMTGPSLGGLLMSHFNWPLIFLINVPVGLIAFYLANKYLPHETNRKADSGYDPIGTILFAMASVMLVLSLSSKHGINVTLLYPGLILILMFYLFERKQPHPMLDFGLLKIRNFVHGNILGAASYCTQTSVYFLLPFYLENLLRYSPASSGLLMTILPVTMAVTAPLAGTLSDRISPQRLTPVSFVLMTFAYLILSTLDSNSSISIIIGGLLFLGIGLGMFGSPNSSSVLGSIPREKAGYAGGFMATNRNLFYSIGTASSVSIFSLFLNRELPNGGYITAYASAIDSVYRIAAFITLLALFLALADAFHAKNTQKSLERL